jgi:hypothetical protein
VYEFERLVGLTVDHDSEKLRQALKGMPVPEPRPGFVDRAFANATQAGHKPAASRLSGLRQFATRWETWIGAALGGAVAATLTLLLLRPLEPGTPEAGAITLALHEARAIDVLIDSERSLDDATIRIVATGSVMLDGFDNEREIDWRANLERGSNLLSLPVVARSAGKGQLVAVIEHGGRTRRVTINLTVRDVEVSTT